MRDKLLALFDDQLSVGIIFRQKGERGLKNKKCFADVIFKPCPDGVKKDGHFRFAPLNLQVWQEEKWARHGNMRNVVLVWIA